MRYLAFFLVPLFSLASCRNMPEAKTANPEEQRAFVAALTKMCDVDRQAGLSPDGDLLAVGVKRTAWITDNVVNPDVIELRVLMSVKGANEQATMLRDKVKCVGLTECPLADSLAKLGEGGLSP